MGLEYDKLLVVEYPSAQLEKYQTSELYLTNSGIQNCKPGHSYGPGKREQHHMHFVLGGRGVLKTNGQVYEMEKGDIFFLQAGEEATYKASKSQPWQYAWVAFGGDNAEVYLDYTGFSVQAPVQRSQVPNEVYQAVIEQMIQERDATIASELTRTSLLYKLLSMLAEARLLCERTGKTVFDYPHETYVSYAQEYMDYHYAHVKINDVASYVGVNRTSLTMMFKKVLGVSPQEYLIETKMSKAAILLTETEESLHEIAAAIGYGDAFVFSKMFKKRFGVPPSIFREAANKEREASR